MWKPMEFYKTNGDAFLILARVDKKGFVHFKTTRISKYFIVYTGTLPKLNFSENFNNLIKEIK